MTAARERPVSCRSPRRARDSILDTQEFGKSIENGQSEQYFEKLGGRSGVSNRERMRIPPVPESASYELAARGENGFKQRYRLGIALEVGIAKTAVIVHMRHMIAVA